eukprot:TRINITY_DN79358_c0_g1_i1.p1 TRINITY_DN79358_c0_g1~~TRINITY_DN79358_c0_g1_i1.p1  ORF type:complete len:185 (+),score=24.69 TRINITY_DN79358_c0_g1_i1:133-687(+)
MILPMPAMPSPGASPNHYAKSRQCTILGILIFQTVITVLRMVIQLDIMGGFIMAICVGLGWYGYKQDLHITYLCYWGMMCFINGVFDLVRFIDFWVKSPFPLFSSKVAFAYNFNSAITLLIPISMLMGALIAWYIYQDAEYGSDDYESGRSGGRYRDEREPFMGRSSNQSNFQAFGGSGQRLGS